MELCKGEVAIPFNKVIMMRMAIPFNIVIMVRIDMYLL